MAFTTGFGKCITLFLVSTASSLMAGPAMAHHSFAMFYQDKPMSLKGVVKEFQWTNPHAFLQMMVPDDKGEMVEWSLELGSPNALSRSGLRKSSFKPGDNITVQIAPMRDGSRGGSLSKVVFADGNGFIFGTGGNNASPLKQGAANE